MILFVVGSYAEPFPPIASHYRPGKKLTVALKDNIVIKYGPKLIVVPRYVQPLECVIQLGESFLNCFAFCFPLCFYRVGDCIFVH